MKITRNEILFSLLSTGIIGGSLWGLDYYGHRTGERNGLIMAITALVATLSLWAAGWLFLHYDRKRQHHLNLNLIYHIVPVIITAMGWGVACVLSDYVQPIDGAWIAVIGGGSLGTHWLVARNKAKGISSKKAFL